MSRRHRNRHLSKLIAACGLLAAGHAFAGDFWWRGDLSNSWSSPTVLNTNFATASDGLIEKFALPGSGDIVRFASSNAANLNTVLGGNRTISGLTTETSLPGDVTISGSVLNFDFSSVGITTNAPRTLTLNSLVTSNSTSFPINTANASSVVNLNSSLGGLVGLTKSGLGTLNLASANSYSLFTAVTAGVLNTTAANALPSGRPLTIGQGATPSSSRVNTGGFAQSVSNLTLFARTSSNLTPINIGSGTLTVTGDISLLDTTTSQGDAFGATIAASAGGTLDLGGGVRNITLAGQNVSQAELTVNAVITNGGINLTANPSSTNGAPAGMVLNASAPNTYTGGTTVNAGTLTVSNTSTTLGPGPLILNTTGNFATRVVLNNPFQTVSSLDSQSFGNFLPVLQLNGTILTVDQSISTFYSGDIQGVGILRKAGSGNLTLFGQFTYTGGTEVVAGTLTMGRPLPVNRPVTLGTPQNGGTPLLQMQGVNSSISSLTIYAPASSSTSVNLDNTTLTLNGNLQLLDTVDGTGNQFRSTIASGPSGVLDLGGGVRTFTIAGQNVAQQELTIQGRLENGGIVLNANPSSTQGNAAGMVLAAAQPNTYAGGTTVNAGFLTVNASTSLGTGPLTLNTTGVVESRVILSNPTQTVTALQTGAVGSVTPRVTLNSTALTVNQNTNTTFAGEITGNGSLTKTGTGILTLTAASSYSGGTTVSQGTLQIGNGGATGSITGNITNNASLIFNHSNTVSFSDNISGTGSLTKTGAGTLTLFGVNTYAGATTVAEGTLTAGSAIAVPPGTALTVGRFVNASNPPARFDTGGFNQSVSSLTIYAPTLNSVSVSLGAAALTLGGDLALLDAQANPGDLGRTTIDASPGGTLSLGGAVRNFTLAGQNVGQQELTINAVLTNGGINLTANPSSANGAPAGMVLSAPVPNTYAGGTTVNAGFLTVNAPTTIGPGPLVLNTTGNVASTVILRQSQSISSLSTGTLGAAPATLNLLNSANLTVNQAGQTTFAGTISGNGALTKTGPGTLILTGDSTYSGGTTINASRIDFGLSTPNGSVAGNISLLSGGVAFFNRSNAFTFPGSITGNGLVAIITPASVTQTFTGNINLTGILQAAGGGTVLLQTPVTTNSTQLFGANTAYVLAPGGTNTLVTGGIFFQTPTNVLYTHDNDLIVNYDPQFGSPIANGIADLLAGRIVPAQHPSGLTTLGIVEAAALGLDSFNSIPIDASTVLAKYTYFGDTDLNGLLDGHDLTNFIEGFSTGATGWHNGDFDYDGAVTPADYALLAAGLSANLPQLLGGGGGSGGNGGSIPEPSALALLAAPAMLMSRRRRLPL